jgi:S1-C subfamily serine protease
MAGTPKELLTQTAPLVRLAVVVLTLGLVGAVGWLWARNVGLKQRLEAERAMGRELAELVQRSENAAPSLEDVDAMRRELESRLSESLARIEALEARAGAREQVIATSASSVVFLQGAYGFVDESGKPLRFVGLGPDGLPLRDASGEPQITLDGEGPPIEIFYTGTAFVVTADGLLLTNRHVALPWAYDAPTELMAIMGLAPVMRRFIGYLPGVEEPLPVELVRASDTRDVALLRCDPVGDEIRPLELAGTPPHPGDEVIVLGYPTGLQALMARADPEAMQEILESGPLDFWQLARRLSGGGHIAPLATVGVVGQVTPGSVVYDAETTHGGSGGPVLNLEGQVLAVNTAVLREFGGSNLGVPAAEAFALLLEPSRPRD